MQFLSENRLNGCQIFGRFGSVKNESEQNFGFPHIPTGNILSKHFIQAYFSPIMGLSLFTHNHLLKCLSSMVNPIVATAMLLTSSLRCC